MKKMAAVMLVIFSIALVVNLSAGGTQEGGKSVTASNPIVIKIGHESSKESAQHRGLMAYKELLDAKSGGRIKFEVFDSSQLGVDKDAVSMIKMGTVQGWSVNTSLLSSIEPAFMTFDLPFMSTSIDELEGIINAGIGKIMNDKLVAKANISIGCWFIEGTRNFYGNRGPIKSPADMQGMKVRVMQNPVMVKTMELLGAKPVPLAASERYLALQSGVVDAAEGAVPLIVLQKEYEVVKYVSMTGHFLTPNVLIFDNRVISGAPADLQAILAEGGKKCQQVAIDYNKKMFTDGQKFLTEKGIKINTVEDMKPFVERVQPIYKEYEPKIGKDVLDKFFALKNAVAKK